MDALSELLRFECLNVFNTDADVLDCSNKLGLLNANLKIGM